MVHVWFICRATELEFGSTVIYQNPVPVIRRLFVSYTDLTYLCHASFDLEHTQTIIPSNISFFGNGLTRNGKN